MTDRSATLAMATNRVQRAYLIALAPPRQRGLGRETRRDWLRREIGKADAQLRSIEDHLRGQHERIAELERDGAETADAVAFLATLQECEQAHETHRLNRIRKLAAS
jgi:hypothetical protein